MSCKSQRTIKHTEKAIAQHHTVTSQSRPPKTKSNGKKRLASPAEDNSGTAKVSLDKASTLKRKLSDQERKQACRHSPPAASDVEEIVLATDDDSVEEQVVGVSGGIDSEQSAVSRVSMSCCALCLQFDDQQWNRVMISSKSSTMHCFLRCWKKRKGQRMYSPCSPRSVLSSSPFLLVARLRFSKGAGVMSASEPVIKFMDSKH